MTQLWKTQRDGQEVCNWSNSPGRGSTIRGNAWSSGDVGVMNIPLQLVQGAGGTNLSDRGHGLQPGGTYKWGQRASCFVQKSLRKQTKLDVA